MGKEKGHSIPLHIADITLVQVQEMVQMKEPQLSENKSKTDDRSDLSG